MQARDPHTFFWLSLAFFSLANSTASVITAAVNATVNAMRKNTKTRFL